MTGKYLLLALLATAAFAQDPVSITPYQLLDARSGQAVACSGCSIYTYAAGTNTPLATYTSSTLATPNTNPVLTNSAGYAVNGATVTGIWVGSSCYKFVAKDSSAVTLFTQDNICDRGAALKALLATSAGAGLIGFQPTGGSVPTTVAAALNSAFLYDIGYSTFALACAAAVSNAKTLAVTKTWTNVPTQTCAANLWFPSGSGGSIQPASAAVVTISKSIAAAPFAIFDYSAGGTVVLSGPIPVISVEWFGAVADGAADGSSGTDNSTAFTRAITNCSTALGPNIRVQLQATGTLAYRITAGVTITGRGCQIWGSGLSSTNVVWTPTVANSDAFTFNNASATQTSNGLSYMTVNVPTANANARRTLVVSDQYRFRSTELSVVGHNTAGTNDGGVTGVFFQDTVDTLFTALRAVNFTGDGVKFSATSGLSTSFECNHCNLESNTGNGALVDRSTSTLFLNSTFQGNLHALTIGESYTASVVVRDSHIGDDNTANPIVLGPAGSAIDFSYLILAGNIYPQIASSSAVKAVVDARAYAKVQVQDLGGYNPNVFTSGFIATDCTKAYVTIQADPTKNIQMGAFPFATDMSCVFGFTGGNNFRAGGLAIPNIVSTNARNWIDYSSPPVGCLDVQPTTAGFLAEVPTGNFGDGQFACISVRNARGGATTVTFAAGFSMDTNSRVVANGTNQTFIFQYHSSVAWSAKPWAFVSESAVNVN